MTHYTTIASTYVPDWGTKQGIREIFQNALDSNDKGNKAGYSYIRKKKQLLVYNYNVKLGKEILLLGNTSKSEDSSQRGKYGEGLKVGCLALVRAGKPVTITNDDELWKIGIKNSKEFNTDVLSFDINDTGNPTGKFTVAVDNITPEEWKEIKSQFLDIDKPDPKTVMKSPQGDILLDPKYKGMIFCGGIYVDTHKNLQYGYNFTVDTLPLNRDRNMANSFDVQWNTSKMWATIAQYAKGKKFDTYDMLKKGVPDVEYIKHFADYTVVGKTVDKFFEENPPKSYPVVNEEEAIKVRYLGYNPVYSSSSFAGVVTSSIGTIDELTKRVEAEYSLFQNITTIDDANIQYVYEVMFKYDPKWKLTIKIAVFEVSATRSIIEKNAVVINSNLIRSKYDILHEVINFYAQQNKKLATQVWKCIMRDSIEGIVES